MKQEEYFHLFEKHLEICLQHPPYTKKKKIHGLSLKIILHYIYEFMLYLLHLLIFKFNFFICKGSSYDVIGAMTFLTGEHDAVSSKLLSANKDILNTISRFHKTYLLICLYLYFVYLLP